MSARPIQAVIFDIDGTLSPVLSWKEFTRHLGASPDTHQAIFEDYLAERITYEQSRKDLLELWRGTGRAHRAVIEAMFDSWPLHPAARPLVDGLHARGIHVCLITGSFDTYAASVARRLGAKHWYANTGLVYDTDGNLISYNYVRDQSGEKLKQLVAFLAQTGLTPSDCVAVGDGPNDLELFKATSRGVLIESTIDRPEMAAVRQSAWQTVADLSQVQPLLEKLY